MKIVILFIYVILDVEKKLISKKKIYIYFDF